MANVCSLLPTTTAMDTGKIKAQLRTIAAGHLVWATVESSQAWLFVTPKHHGAEFIHAPHACFPLINTINPSLPGHSSHSNYCLHEPAQQYSLSIFFLRLQICSHLLDLKCNPKDVASPAALSMVSCQSSHSLCFSGSRSAFLALKCNILTSVSAPSWRSCRWLSCASCDAQLDLCDSWRTGSLTVIWRVI